MSKRSNVFDDDQVCKIKKTNDNNNQDEESEVEHVEADTQLVVKNAQPAATVSFNEDDLLCNFDSPSDNQILSWFDKITFNLRRNNHSVMCCYTPFNKLFECLSFSSQCVSLHKSFNLLYPNVSDEIVIEPPKNHLKTTYNIGMHITGGYLNFYFYDWVKVRRCKSVYGNFLSLSWTNISQHNKMFGHVFKQYMDIKDLKLSNNVIVNMPVDEKLNTKIMFVTKFFDITVKNNEMIYTSNDLIHSVVSTPFSVQRFDELFAFNADDKPSNEIEMLMGAIVEGIKVGKNDTMLMTVNKKMINEKSYSLAIKPMIFFKFEQ
ncbi:DBP [Urbanus proteus nucleopolyhedrovirus]|uniref:DBP n=1 Tax=Urbanus proteus nucleopolyhedrovirus TaxID=1675866 RepID=A0A161C6V2_9ABAC|nr:DBP [Urbanus proteus nucleopolyhedrovirus]AKR17285.1 DBP [Urbanus proteus nucleopolyhedrovirus]